MTTAGLPAATAAARGANADEIGQQADGTINVGPKGTRCAGKLLPVFTNFSFASASLKLSWL